MSVHWKGRGPGHLCRKTSASASSDPLAAFALALDFKNGAYWSAGAQAASLSAMAGYSYTRSGQVSFVNSSNGITPFAANAPPILSAIGYEAVGALTNFALFSQQFDNAGWSKFAGATATADTATAPDGTTTADLITMSGGGNFVYQDLSATTSAGTYTASVFLKAGTRTATRLWWTSASFTNGAYVDVNLSTGAVTTGTAGTGVLVSASATSVGNGWFRVVVVATLPVGGFWVLGNDAGGGGNHLAWQGQVIAGNFADGGPIILTTSAAASIGAQTLSVSVPNGTYSAVYTFSDNSTQTISTTISGGAFTMPAYPATLNKPAVSRVTLA